MNFEDQTSRGLGRFTSGTSLRRFIVALVSVVIILIGVFIQDHFKKQEERDLADLVNPLMGTDSEYKLSNGNTNPLMSLTMGYEFLGTTNPKDGGWLELYLR